MAWIRAYVDKKITADGGGDHSRILDFEAADDDFYRGTGPDDRGVIYLTDTGRAKLTLEKDEQADNFAELSFPDQALVE